MDRSTPTNDGYTLGHDADELARLDRQAASIERATLMLLRAAGLNAGQRVLDLGTGLGHVARLAGRLVGARGSVVGLDRSRDALAVARRRVEEAGEAHVSFVEGDVGAWRSAAPFDVVVGRLLLFHVTDPVAVVHHQLANLRQDGLLVAIDYDGGAVRAEPDVPLVNQVAHWVRAAFTATGASERIGARLGVVLERAGLVDVTTFGVQAYLAPNDPAGPAMLAGVVRSLAQVMQTHGIVSPEALGLTTLTQRLSDALRQADAVLLPPTLACAWGRSSPPA